jgi:hypothetical protein
MITKRVRQVIEDYGKITLAKLKTLFPEDISNELYILELSNVIEIEDGLVTLRRDKDV